VGATTHLAHQALLLHLAAELAQSLLELLRILDDYLQASITPFFLEYLLGGPGRRWTQRTIGLDTTVKDSGCPGEAGTPRVPRTR
jgi:hypothetical protein